MARFKRPELTPQNVEIFIACAAAANAMDEKHMMYEMCMAWLKIQDIRELCLEVLTDENGDEKCSIPSEFYVSK